MLICSVARLYLSALELVEEIAFEYIETSYVHAEDISTTTRTSSTPYHLGISALVPGAPIVPKRTELDLPPSLRCSNIARSCWYARNCLGRGN